MRKERPEWPPPEPTILEGGGDDFLRRRPCPGPVAGLHHQAVLGELVEVVQGVDLAVPGGVDADNVELEVAPCAVLAVTYLVAADNPVLQMLLGSLKRRKEYTKENLRKDGREASNPGLLGKQIQSEGRGDESRGVLMRVETGMLVNSCTAALGHVLFLGGWGSETPSAYVVPRVPQPSHGDNDLHPATSIEQELLSQTVLGTQEQKWFFICFILLKVFFSVYF